MTKPTFEQLCKIAPHLRELDIFASGVSSDGEPHFCANAVWITTIKPQLLWTVGWGVRGKYPEATAEDQNLISSEEAYDVAYRHIYGRLPDCRDCSCL